MADLTQGIRWLSLLRRILRPLRSLPARGNWRWRPRAWHKPSDVIAISNAGLIAAHAAQAGIQPGLHDLYEGFSPSDDQAKDSVGLASDRVKLPQRMVAAVAAMAEQR